MTITFNMQLRCSYQNNDDKISKGSEEKKLPPPSIYENLSHQDCIQEILS